MLLPWPKVFQEASPHIDGQEAKHEECCQSSREAGIQGNIYCNQIDARKKKKKKKERFNTWRGMVFRLWLMCTPIRKYRRQCTWETKKLIYLLFGDICTMWTNIALAPDPLGALPIQHPQPGPVRHPHPTQDLCPRHSPFAHKVDLACLHWFNTLVPCTHTCTTTNTTHEWRSYHGTHTRIRNGNDSTTSWAQQPQDRRHGLQHAPRHRCQRTRVDRGQEGDRSE